MPKQLRIDPQFKGVISALRTASTKQFGGLYQLDKQATSSDDLLDALRMSYYVLDYNKKMVAKGLSLPESHRQAI
jgi:hypothetical protein